MTRVRAETATDYAAVHEVNKIAFGGEGESRLVEALRKSRYFCPKLSLVAVKDQKVVGHILFSPAVIERVVEIGKKAENNDVPVLVLAPMAVLPEFQRQGIGSQLILHGLEECKRLGFGIAILIAHPGSILASDSCPPGQGGWNASTRSAMKPSWWQNLFPEL